MNSFRSRLAILPLAICAMATAVPVAAQTDDERSPVANVHAASKPHVTAFAGDSMQAPNSFMSAMLYLDSIPAPAYYSALTALAVSLMLMSQVVERRGRRARNGGGGEDERTHRRAYDSANWRHQRNGISAMSATPGGG